jgi:hypothetical protein
MSARVVTTARISLSAIMAFLAVWLLCCAVRADVPDAGAATPAATLAPADAGQPVAPAAPLASAPVAGATTGAVDAGGADGRQGAVAGDAGLTDERALAAAADAAKQLSGASSLNGAGKRKAILGGLASLFLALIWAIRRFGIMLLNDQAVRAFALLLGVVVFLLSAVAADMPLWQSVEIAMAGPAALALHELGKLGKPSSWLKAKAKAAAKVEAKAPILLDAGPSL